MHTGLSAMLAALDASPSPVYLFLRDDDAGWDDPRLMALLDGVGKAGVPIDLAVIPEAATVPLARELCTRMDANRNAIGVHQHGLVHLNHEAQGRKCEFGSSRPADQQRADLVAGRQRLRSLFDGRLDGIFTPPWNRCSEVTPGLLAELGYAALSRTATAPTEAGLFELPVHVDWSKQRRAELAAHDGGGDRIGFEMARCIRREQCVGLMLHHADMEDSDLDLLTELLRESRAHPKARWTLMRSLVPARSTLAAPPRPTTSKDHP